LAPIEQESPSKHNLASYLNDVPDSRVLLPKRNRKDVEADLPESVRNEITFVFLSTVDQAIEEVFGKDIWRQGEGIRVEARL